MKPLSLTQNSELGTAFTNSDGLKRFPLNIWEGGIYWPAALQAAMMGHIFTSCHGLSCHVPFVSPLMPVLVDGCLELLKIQIRHS